MQYYFAYGSNTNLTTMAQRCPSAERIGRAWIDGYVFRWRTYADVEIDVDSYVIGVLWRVDDADLQSLDRHEGYPHVYFRQRVLINHGDAQHVGWTYMMDDQRSESSPAEAYRTIVLDGYHHNDLSDQQLITALERLRL